jgi:precorrin-6B methylase 2
MVDKSTLEAFIEGTPKGLRVFYLFCVRCLKKLFKITGVLYLLDQRARKNQTCHYLRSLLAIHDIDDMITLDVPWWTYSAIKAIEKYISQLPSPPVVFEYGSGASTIWLAKRSRHVTSFEHDVHWYQQLEHNLSPFSNITLVLKEPNHDLSDPQYLSQKIKTTNFKSYVTGIADFSQQYDIIVIDGRCREKCLEYCIPFLKPRGIIIFDNSNRKRYQQALLHSPLQRQSFYGLVPGSPFKSETLILKKPL